MRRGRANIYQVARKSAGLTQEQAADLVYISTRSLADYENNRTIPSDEVVCHMIEVYNAAWLGYEHLRRSSEVGRRYLPDIDLSDLAKSVLRLQKEVQDVNRINSDMVEIACDGVIDQHEDDKWQQVTKEISEMAGAALAVVFSQKEKRALI